MDLKEALSNKLTKKQLGLLKTSFDIVGNIAILEIPEELSKKENLIAKTLQKIHPNIKTIYKKSGERSGVYRLRKLERITGNGPETVHKESCCLFKLNIEKAYFSVRESTERLRISEKVKQKENILVLFSGVGPFGIVIAKNHPDCKIDMVEINPDACRYSEENTRMNKVSDRVSNYCGDFKEISPTLKKYDRVVMPLPETAYKYLDLVLDNNSKKGAIIHLYCIGGEKKLETKRKTEADISQLPAKGVGFHSGSDYEKTVNLLIKKKKIKLVEKRKVLPYAPGVWKFCLELKVL